MQPGPADGCVHVRLDGEMIINHPIQSGRSQRCAHVSRDDAIIFLSKPYHGPRGHRSPVPATPQSGGIVS